jgi:nucleosome assembly protein 1-like 1
MMIANNLIPDAVNWFTGDAFADDEEDEFDEDDDEDEFDDEDEEDDEDDEDDEDEDEDEEEEFVGGKKSFAAPPAMGGAAKEGEQPPECKQQ